MPHKQGVVFSLQYTLIAQLDRAQGYEPWFCGSSNLSGRAIEKGFTVESSNQKP